MMAYSEDHIALAAEYALGTLDADERALVETMMIVDTGFLAIVHAWERKLAPLHQMVSPVEPPGLLWERIRTAIPPREKPVAPVVESPVDAVDMTATDLAATDSAAPNLAAADVAAAEVTPDAPPAGGALPLADGASDPSLASESDRLTETDAAPKADAELTSRDMAVASATADRLAQREPAKASSGFGRLMALIAAAFAALAGLQIVGPQWLPAALRPKPEIRVEKVLIPPPPPAAQFVAALQPDARDPGFVLSIDARTRRYTVRRVGPPPPAGTSYELWIVPAGTNEPRSLGVIGADTFTTSDALASFDAATVNGAIYAVTPEPEGGAPNGKPTAQPLWAGKLYESVPAR